MRKTKSDAKKAILRHIERREKRLLIGEASLVLGPNWGLKETEELLDEMVEEGTFRVDLIDHRKNYLRCKPEI